MSQTPVRSAAWKMSESTLASLPPTQVVEIWTPKLPPAAHAIVSRATCGV